MTLSVATATDAIETALNELGVDRAHVVGSSLGGWLSLELAVRGRARSVVGVCPAGGWDPGSREERSVGRFFRNNYRLLRVGSPLVRTVANRRALRRVALRRVVARPERLTPEAALTMMRGGRGCAIVDQALSLLGSDDPFGNLGPIDCPVRILYGTADRVLTWPGHFRKMRRLLPDADWVALEGLGHLPMWDDPVAVADAILSITSVNR